LDVDPDDDFPDSATPPSPGSTTNERNEGGPVPRAIVRVPVITFDDETRPDQVYESSCDELELEEIISDRLRRFERAELKRRDVCHRLDALRQSVSRSVGASDPDPSMVEQPNQSIVLPIQSRDLTGREWAKRIENVRKRGKIGYEICKGYLARSMVSQDPYPPTMCVGCMAEGMQSKELGENFRQLLRYMQLFLGSANFEMHCRRVHHIFMRKIYALQKPENRRVWRTWQIMYHFKKHTMNATAMHVRETERSLDAVERIYATIVNTERASDDSAAPAEFNPKLYSELRGAQSTLLRWYHQHPEKLAFPGVDNFYDSQFMGQLAAFMLPSLDETPADKRNTLRVRRIASGAATTVAEEEAAASVGTELSWIDAANEQCTQMDNFR
jgi:hypothetical protein